MAFDNKQLRKQLYLVSILNLLILFFIAADYVDALETGNTFILRLFFVFTTFSHFFFLSIIPLVMGYLALWLTKSQTFSKVLFSVLWIAELLVMKTDATIFSQFRYHLSPIVFSMMFGKRATDIFQFSTSNIVLAVLFIVLIIGIQFLFFAIAKKAVKRSFKLYINPTFGLFLVTFLASNLIYAWGDANYDRFVMQYKKTFPVYYPLTADNLLMKLNLVDSEKIKRNESLVENGSQNSVLYPLHPIQSAARTAKKNILFLVIDSWRYDLMTKEVTPNIFEFSQKCQRFNNHQSGSNMTTGGIFTLFYGIPATYFTAFTTIEKGPVFIEELQKQNYDLDIYGSSTLENPPFNRNVFSGIKNLRLETKGESPSERDQNITNEWIENVAKKQGKPFFGFLFFDAAHGFDYPKDYKTPFTPSLEEVNYLDLKDGYDPTQLINRYKNSLHFIDSQIGKILKQLEVTKLLENTIVVITSDHGQEFNDNKKGYWQHGGNFSKYQIQVPMLVYDAGKTPQQFSHLSLHYDVVPTMMQSVLGVKNPLIDYTYGQNLYNTKQRDWFVCGYNQKYSVIERNRITNIYESGLYDVLDLNLNPLDEDINYDVIFKAFQSNTTYYVKKAGVK